MRRTPTSPRPDTLFPYTTLFRSLVHPAFAPASTTGLLNHLPRAMTGRARPLDNEKALLGPHLAMTVTGLASLHARSEEHTSELQTLMRISYAVFCWKKKRK